jgi:hypothetical protein
MVASIRLPLLGVAAIALGASHAAAQIFPQGRAADGDRVRITAPSYSPSPIVGYVLARTADTIVLRGVSINTNRAFPTTAIQKLERSEGPRRCSGVVPGLIAGAVLGVAAVASDPETGALVAPFAALTGYAVASFVGKKRTCERWTEVPILTG